MTIKELLDEVDTAIAISNKALENIDGISPENNRHADAAYSENTRAISALRKIKEQLGF